jgi:hypothetical protein
MSAFGPKRTLVASLATIRGCSVRGPVVRWSSNARCLKPYSQTAEIGVLYFSSGDVTDITLFL